MATSYENNLSCAVCLELYYDPRFLPCGHSYCLKCLLDVQNKSTSKSIIKCPICQAELSSENSGPASFPKNYDLNSLVQLFILKTRGQDTTSQTYFCEICDLQKPAERFCSDCETMYCETCFNTCHPMSGKLAKHKIVNIDENFKLEEDTKVDDRNMYCTDCDDLISAADVSSHKKHDIVTLSEAHSIFKVKLDEATGNIDRMQSTLESDLDRSKEKKVLLESMFEEIEMELARKKEDVLMEHNSEVKEAQAGIDNMLPAMSAYRELQGREDMISFILECQNIFRGSPLKDEFNEVHEMFDRINSMTLSNQAILTEIRTLEDGGVLGNKREEQNWTESESNYGHQNRQAPECEPRSYSDRPSYREPGGDSANFHPGSRHGDQYLRGSESNFGHRCGQDQEREPRSYNDRTHYRDSRGGNDYNQHSKTNSKERHYDNRGSHYRNSAEDDVTFSKSLSYLLRHGAEKQKLELLKGALLSRDEDAQSVTYAAIQMAQQVDRKREQMMDKKKKNKKQKGANANEREPADTGTERWDEPSTSENRATAVAMEDDSDTAQNEAASDTAMANANEREPADTGTERWDEPSTSENRATAVAMEDDSDTAQNEAASDTAMASVGSFQLVTDVAICQSIVSSILDSKLHEKRIALMCLGTPDKVKVITVADPDKHVYMFDVEENCSLMTEGQLQDLLESRVMKIMHGCSIESKRLFNQFSVILDFTPVFDTLIASLYHIERINFNFDDTSLEAILNELKMEFEPPSVSMNVLLNQFEHTASTITDDERESAVTYVNTWLPLHDELVLLISDEHKSDLKKIIFAELLKDE